jgi:hypothetical protein
LFFSDGNLNIQRLSSGHENFFGKKVHKYQ